MKGIVADYPHANAIPRPQNVVEKPEPERIREKYHKSTKNTNLGENDGFQPLHPSRAGTKPDVNDFRNMEKLIDEWVAAIKIAATTLELDKENFIKLVS
ncbi:UNVERIFIED_CONTAM: hypothetical protein Sradi_5097100 [Sesamum radiatum]|uniref:Uncharacterized protein n=1 Tax=Sesamum radiatum TaxID=300843 RepID=A0AAW2M2Q1_SESRA